MITDFSEHPVMSFSKL